jgi:predicted RNase H-like HicB family nuclease
MLIAGFYRTHDTITSRPLIGDTINFFVETEQEEDGRWLAEVLELPGVLAYGDTPEQARAQAQALALRVVAERLEHGEIAPDLVTVSFAAA